MNPVFENELLAKVKPLSSVVLVSVFCHAAPACTPMYQPAQLAGGGTYCGALIAISPAWAPETATAAKPVAIRKPFFRMGTLLRVRRVPHYINQRVCPPDECTAKRIYALCI